MRAHEPLSLFVFLLLAAGAFAQQYAPGEEGTFSIIGRDPATGELGIAVQSKTIAVGARTRGGKGGLAVFAHQSSSNPMYSTLGVELLEAGMTPQQALDMMLRSDEGRANRQVAILDIQGRTAAFTSPTITDWKGHRCGTNYCAQGNTLVGPEVVDAMAQLVGEPWRIDVAGVVDPARLGPLVRRGGEHHRFAVEGDYHAQQRH